MGFLSPYLILDLTNERGIFAGKMLADLGAQVIQIEPLEGSAARQMGPFIEQGNKKGRSLFWEAYACNKKGITCNLSTEEGIKLFKKLCEQADFLFESEEPGLMEDRGLSYEQLRKINPKLIHVSITPFGSAGPKAHYASSDLTLWAAGGALYPTIQDGRPPVRVTLPQSYMHAAADAAGGALIAHFSRLNTGIGQHVDISIQRSVAQCTLSRNLSVAVGDQHFEKNSLISLSAASNKSVAQNEKGKKLSQSKWKVRDGYVELNLSMGQATGRFTNHLMDWLLEEKAIEPKLAAYDWRKLPELLQSNKMNWEDIDQIFASVSKHLKKFTKKELLHIGLKRKIVIAPIQNFQDLAENDQLRARNFWMGVKKDNQTFKIPGHYATTTENGFAFNNLAPELGEHNHEVYGAILGLSKKELIDLENQGVI